VRSPTANVYNTNANLYEPSSLSGTFYMNLTANIQYGMITDATSAVFNISATNKIYLQILRVA
jgi:hypothetical protein